MIHIELKTPLQYFLVLFSVIIICISLFMQFLFTKPSYKTIKSYPIIGFLLAIYENKNSDDIQFIYNALTSSPSATFVLQRPFHCAEVITANPENVSHINKGNLQNYNKGRFSRERLFDLFGNGIFNADGNTWKLQREAVVHAFSTKSLRKFVESVVETELSDRLIPILSDAADNNTVLDFQDILQRFGFDNICKISFGYDAAHLSPAFPETKLVSAINTANYILSQRNNHAFHSIFWKVEKFLNINPEKKLRCAVREVRGLAKQIVQEKKQELSEKSTLESADILSGIIRSGDRDETFAIDLVVSMILAGREASSAALVWFFWLVSKNPQVESEILQEIEEKSVSQTYEETKEMVYTQAALSESMRLFPPVPLVPREAINDDVWPDGTRVMKGNKVGFHVYVMGRLEKLWGKDWRDFRPERWLKRDNISGKWNYAAKDPYIYTVFQGGPRSCLGKDMAYMQMKRVVAGVLRRFRVMPVLEEGRAEPVYLAQIISKMKDGFQVRVVKREKKTLSFC